MSGSTAPSLPHSPGAPRHRRGKGKRRRARDAKAALGVAPPPSRQSPSARRMSALRASRLALHLRDVDYMEAVESVAFAAAVLGFVVSFGQFFG